MSWLSDETNRWNTAIQENFDAGNWKKRFGITGDILNPTTYHDAWGGGEWMNRFGLISGPKGFEDSGDWFTKSSKWWTQLGGDKFDEQWGGGAWMDPGKRNVLGLDREGNIPGTGTNIHNLLTPNLGSVLDAAVNALGDDGGNGDGTPTTTADAETLAKGFDLGDEQAERDRLAKMRRMLAGRYGRAETNLTGGTGFGSGSQRTIGGYS